MDKGSVFKKSEYVCRDCIKHKTCEVYTEALKSKMTIIACPDHRKKDTDS